MTAWKEARETTWQRGGGDRDETFDLLSVEGHVESRREVSVDEGEKDVEEEEEIHDGASALWRIGAEEGEEKREKRHQRELSAGALELTHCSTATTRTDRSRNPRSGARNTSAWTIFQPPSSASITSSSLVGSFGSINQREETRL